MKLKSFCTAKETTNKATDKGLISKIYKQHIQLNLQETQVQALDWKDPLEKVMATHSGILAWEVQWAEEPGGLQFMGSQKSQTQLKC